MLCIFCGAARTGFFTSEHVCMYVLALAAFGGLQKPELWTVMIKKIILALLLVAVVAGGLAGIKALQIKKMIDQGKSMVMPPAVVSAVNATSASWETVLTAVGSVTAVQGVTLTAETPVSE